MSVILRLADENRRLQAELESLRTEYNALVDRASIDIVALPMAVKRVEELEEERNRAEQDYSDLIHLCELAVKAYYAFQERNDHLLPEEQSGYDDDLDCAIDNIKKHVSPDDTQKGQA